MSLGDWGWDHRWAAEAAALGADPGAVARIVGQDRGRFAVETSDGPEPARLRVAHGGLDESEGPDW